MNGLWPMSGLHQYPSLRNPVYADLSLALLGMTGKRLRLADPGQRRSQWARVPAEETKIGLRPMVETSSTATDVRTNR